MSNVLDRKIRQMHAALADLATEDLASVKAEFGSDGVHTYTKVDFDKDSDEIALANAASLLVANIASMKDHLKVWCTVHKVPFSGDALIDSSRSVALIHDLWNVDKHAELSRPPRSGHTPSLRNLQTMLSISTGTAANSFASWTMDPQTGHMTTDASGGGAVQLTLQAQIVDASGSIVGDFSHTCREAIAEWEKALSAAGVPLP
jgi:hypothetical protein